MPLEPYKRGETYWFRGRIEELPNCEYIRKSTGKTTKAGAQAVVNDYIQRRLRIYYGSPISEFTFADALLIYDAKPKEAENLLLLQEHVNHLPVTDISEHFVKSLCRKLQPNNGTATWDRSIITPIRAVINNAHKSGKCPHCRITGFSADETDDQNESRGAETPGEIVPADWPWIIAFRNAANPYLKGMSLLMFETAARISQVIQLEPKNLISEEAKIWLPRSKKTKAQWVKISPELATELSTLKPKRPIRTKKQYPLRIFGYASKDGVYGAWKTTCKRAGIQYIPPHAAGRHAFATELIVNQGIDVKTVADAGRWADPALVLRRYAHSKKADEQKTELMRTARVQAEREAKGNAL